jgi:NAD(P)-dependent dehydrogenase (short-subunit alcohol dehydrogenase family)
MQTTLEERVALVTGAASGIGRATALAFARAGARVVVADRDGAGNKETAQQICDAGGVVLAVETDVSSPGDVDEMVKETLRAFGRLDYACNNAGIEGPLAPTADYTIQDWDRVMAVNLRGVWLCMRAEIPPMLRNGGGAIVNMASILGKVGFARAPAYTAAKHGIVGLTKVAALEYAAQGIRVNVVCPAFIETPMLERAGITSDPAMREAVTKLHPIGRMGTSEEVAEAVLWLSSPAASFVTGHALLVDGGFVAQ